MEKMGFLQGYPFFCHLEHNSGQGGKLKGVTLPPQASIRCKFGHLEAQVDWLQLEKGNKVAIIQVYSGVRDNVQA